MGLHRLHLLTGLLVLAGGAVVATSCADAPEGATDTNRQYSRAILDSAMAIQVSRAGARVCEADGRADCPLHSAYANWLDDTHYALWEPGRVVETYAATGSTGTRVGATGREPGQYLAAMAVGAMSGKVAVLDAMQGRALWFDRNGTFEQSQPMPIANPSTSLGFSGTTLIRQSMGKGDSDDMAELVVRRAQTLGDSTGPVLFRAPLPWLQLSEKAGPEPATLFPPMPAYTVLANGDFCHTPGTRAEITCQRPDGAVRWSTSLDVAPVPITPQQLAIVRREVLANPLQQPDSDRLDAMIAKSTGNYPPIAQLIASPKGEVLVMAPVIPGATSYGGWLLDAGGKLVGRLTLPTDTRVLLFSGDAILVHRPSEGELREVAWLGLTRSPSPSSSTASQVPPPAGRTD